MKRRIIWTLYRAVLKPILFLFPPETMHDTFGKVGAWLGRSWFGRRLTRKSFYYAHPILQQTVCGIEFPNPVGLSAWFDKDIQLPNIIGDIGFGREECGSVTYRSYQWNPWPRLYRLKKSKALVVNYWLKNNWIEYAKSKIEKSHCKVPLFVSLAKTNCIETCDLQKWIEDYVASLEALHPSSKIKWFVLNISCPNAFGGEDYTSPERLSLLLKAVKKVSVHQPIFIKLPVDKPREEIKAIIETCLEYEIAGIIISNLTKYREKVIEKDEIKNIPWWISWKPTQEKSDHLIAQTYKTFGKKILIVGVGGIFSAQDAYHKIKQGATLVALITGMIYQWPQLIGEINKWLVKLLEKDWFNHISEAIGKDVQ